MQHQEVITGFRALEVTSPAFRPGAMIPRKYTCEGEDINPPIDIGELPPSTRSLAVVADDPDAPSGTWLHWLVWNIAVTHHIHENEVPGDQGVNDFGRNDYGGPCPPSGTHRYFFRIYALDDLLDLPEGSTRAQVESAMRDHILAYGELMGVYKRGARNR